MSQLRTAVASYEHEIIVIDNNSLDGSIAHLRRECADLHVLINATNVGYAQGNNTGARTLITSGCDLLLFANPDVFLDRGALEKLVATLLDDPAAGCCGGLPVNEQGVSRMACRTRPSLFEKLVLYSPLSRLRIVRSTYRKHFLDPLQIENGADVFAVSGCLLLFRAAAFEQVGGFDESTFLYEEELLMGERLARAGWKTVVATECRYFHREAQSTSQIPYRRRLHFIESEQHLLREVYRLEAPARYVWRLYRYIELIPAYVKTAWERKSVPRIGRCEA